MPRLTDPDRHRLLHNSPHPYWRPPVSPVGEGVRPTAVVRPRATSPASRGTPESGFENDGGSLAERLHVPVGLRYRYVVRSGIVYGRARVSVRRPLWGRWTEFLGTPRLSLRGFA